MKQIRNIHFIGFFLMLVLGTKAQNLQISTGHNSGAHLYEGETITAPATGTNQVGISGSAEVEYKATNLINLKEGFEAGGFSGNGFFHAYIAPHTTDYSGGLLDNTSFENIQPSASKAVGYTPGASNVSPSGAATYSIPIQLPPGTNGMVPSLSINYNSQAGNGILGMGWSLGGISAITRVPKTIYHNGSVSPVKLDNTDDYSLDGSRLILVDGVYHTEQESFSKITPNSMNSYGPQGFTVIAKNGITTEYGLSDDSKFKKEGTDIVLFWLVNKVYDQYGNYVKYVYKQENNEIVLDRVLYTGNDNAGLSPYNVVKFKYELREDANTQYVSGIAVNSKSILKEISIIADGQAFKRFKMDYGFNLYSYLRQIKEIGCDGSELNPTVFKYGKYTPNELNITESDIVIGQSTDIFSYDFNNDGLFDILSSNFEYPDGIKHHNNMKVYLNSTSGDFSLSAEQELNNGNNEVENFKFVFPTTFMGSDFNGDGFGDILISQKHSQGSMVYLDNLIIEYFNGLNLNPTTLEMESGYQHIPYNGRYLYTGDFDGDGAMDILIIIGKSYQIISNGLAETHYQYDGFISYPNKGLFNLKVTNVDDQQWPYAKELIVIDFDGDGVNELMVIDEPDENDYLSTNIYSFKINSSQNSINASIKYSGGYPTQYHYIYPGDFNGDAITDLLTHVKVNNEWKWLIGYGDGLNGYLEKPISFLSNVLFDDEMMKFKIGDYNGDGKSDILLANQYNVENHTRFDIYYSYGLNNFIHEHFESNDYLLQNSSTTGQSDPQFTGQNGLISGDFNGDGKMDELAYKSIFQPFKILLFHQDSKERYLESIKNGFGFKTSINYTWLPKETNYTPRIEIQSYPQCNFEAPLIVVSSLSNSDGIGGQEVINYKYKEATINKTGKGFLGFSFVEAINNSTGVTAQSKNWLHSINIANNKDIYIPYLKAQKTFLTSDTTILITEAVYSNTFESIGTNKRYKVLPERVINKDYLNNVSIETNYDNYDNYGNILQSTTKYSDVGQTTTAQTTLLEYGSYSNEGSWCPIHPSFIKTTNNRSGEIFSKTTSFTYIADKGNLYSKTEFAGLDESVTTTNVYTELGNLKRSTISSNGLPSIIQRFEYDNNKERFICKKINPLNQSEEFTFDIRWGKLLTSKSLNGLIFSYEYDGFGNLKKTIDPHGNSTDIISNWSFNNPDQNIIYSIRTTRIGTPESTEYFDILGRKLLSKSVGFNNTPIVTQKQTFDSKGNLVTTTSPYIQSETPITTTYSYSSDFNRLSSITIEGIGTTTFSYSNEDGNSVITTTDPAQRQRHVSKDATGKIIKSGNNDEGTTNHFYDGAGNLKQTRLIVGSAYNIVKLEYDDYGRQKKLIDLNGGTIEYVYNAYGQLKSQDGPLPGNVDLISFEYDILGRPQSKTNGNQITTFEYYISGGGLNKLKKTMDSEGSFSEILYDDFGRTISFKEKQGNFSEIFTTQYTYNNLDQLVSTIYPSGNLTTTNIYDENGFLTLIKDGNNFPLFSTTEINGRGQLTKYKLGNDKITENTYNNHGYLERTFTSNIQDLETSFNLQTGNLDSRQDNLKILQETFTYDYENRLTKALPYNMSNSQSIADIVNGPFELEMTYDYNGNITSKTGIGNYYYESPRPNAVTAVDNNRTGELVSPIISTLQQNVGYQHDRPVTIKEKDYCYRLFYGTDDQRAVTELRQDNNSTSTQGDSILISRRFYSINYEKLILGNEIFEINYIPGPDGLVSVYVKKTNESNGNYYFVYKDHLGSILTFTDDQGNVVYEQNFDAWGNRRNSNTWKYENTISEDFKWLNRGFTGHEHLYEFGLVNMNARLYDPLVGRFLSVDNFVQNATSTQGFNRFSYCLNNPLKFTDPSGEIYWAPIIAMAVVGGGMNWMLNGFRFDAKGAEYFLIGATAGFAGGLAGAGVAAGIGATGFIAGAGSGAAGGFTSGFITGAGNAWIGGANFGSGLLTGLESAAKSGISGGILGGAFGGIDALDNDLNFWSGKNVEVGRTRFSFSNKPRPKNRLFWVRDGNPEEVIRYDYDYKALSNGSMAEDIKNPVALDATGNTPQWRELSSINRAHGKIEITYNGSIPKDESVTIAFKDGRRILSLSGGFYKSNTISAFDPQTMYISMTGFPVYESNSNAIFVRPSFDTKVLIYIPQGH